MENVTDPVYYPNSVEDAPAADTNTYAEHEDILARVFDYWRNIDKTIGDRIEVATLEKRSAGTSETGGARFD